MDNISNLLTEDLGYGKIEEYVSNFDFGKFKISENRLQDVHFLNKFVVRLSENFSDPFFIWA